jgi:hypothetical protein
VFSENATLYRAIVGSIRTIRDYVEGGPEPCCRLLLVHFIKSHVEINGTLVDQGRLGDACFSLCLGLLQARASSTPSLLTTPPRRATRLCCSGALVLAFTAIQMMHGRCAFHSRGHEISCQPSPRHCLTFLLCREYINGTGSNTLIFAPADESTT